MDTLKVRIHNKDEDAWAELGTILMWLSRIVLALVFLAPILTGVVALGTWLFQTHLHPLFCILGSALAAVAIWYAFHTLRWLIIAYGSTYSAAVAGLIFVSVRQTSDEIWATAAALACAGFGIVLSLSVYRRGALARGWGF